MVKIGKKLYKLVHVALKIGKTLVKHSKIGKIGKTQKIGTNWWKKVKIDENW